MTPTIIGSNAGIVLAIAATLWLVSVRLRDASIVDPWGYGCFALQTPLGWIALAGPALMTFLLLRVSGVTMLDAHLRATKPGYAAYCERTPAFFPRWRRG